MIATRHEGGAAMAGPSALDHTTWTLTGWGGDTELPRSVRITAEFADGKVYGTSGINRYNASVTLSDAGEGAAPTAGTVSFGPVMMTMMAGPEDAMRAEQGFVRRLEAVTAYRLDGDRLVLVDGAGDSLIMISDRATDGDQDVTAT